MKNLVFNEEIFEIGDVVKVTYIENRLYNNVFCTNTFEEIEVLLYDEEHGFYLQTELEDIPFIRVLKENSFPNLILKMEKVKK